MEGCSCRTLRFNRLFFPVSNWCVATSCARDDGAQFSFFLEHPQREKLYTFIVLSTVVVVVVVVVRTWVLNGGSLSINRHRVHLIQVAEHPGVRLPASPPPWASTSRWTEAEKCSRTAANYSSSSPPCGPIGPPCTTDLCVPVSVAQRSVLKRRDELNLKHLVFTVSENCNCGVSAGNRAPVAA